MTSRFAFQPEDGGLLVRLAPEARPPVPVHDWTAPDGAPSGAGTWIRLRDEGAAREIDDGLALQVAWHAVAAMNTDELQDVGLPDPAPAALQVTATGAIHDPDFEPRYGFLRAGRPLPGACRTGAWLRIGDSSFVLFDPIYTITEAIDAFRQAAEAGVAQRMLSWGRIAELLPDDAVVDDRLAGLQIVVASAFELDPRLNDRGEPDFDPVVGQIETTTNAAGEENRQFRCGLPPARQGDFARYFRRFDRVRPRYPVGNSMYVMLTPEVERALGAARRAQKGTPEERRDFLMTPAAEVRQALDRADAGGEESEADTIEVDAVFWDDGLSDRVRGVGIWEPKVLPWMQRAGEPWLPTEQLGLRIDGRTVALDPDDLPDLHERLQRAVERGEPAVHVKGVELPATPESLEAVEQLMDQLPPGRTSPATTGPKSPRSDGGQTHGVDVVLRIRDNLDEVRYRTARQRRTADIHDVPLELTSTLYPHQQEALAWLCSHWEAGSPGALLADDMGLGKTLEALAFLCRVKNVAGGAAAGPILIVAPTGLLRNWAAEHAIHLRQPGLGRCLEAHGTSLRTLRRGPTGKETRHAAAAGLALQSLDIERLRRADWVLTTYETLRDYQHSFGRVRWCAAVFDEAHKMKNPGAKLTEAALAMNVDFALLMTGTPVENRPADVWSLLDRAAPGRAGTLKEFSRRFEGRGGADADRLKELRALLIEPAGEPQQRDRRPDPGSSAAHPPERGAGTKTNEDRCRPSLMMRRLKEDHVEGLPEKDIVRLVVDMPPAQAEVYEQLVQEGRRTPGRILEVLQKLRSASLHPVPPGNGSMSDDAYIRASARLAETVRILDDIAGRRDKALLFVEARSMQSFLIGALRRRFALPEDPLVINGDVAGGIRKQRVDLFQQRHGFDVMILSPRAGGVGLTLTAANHVIHLSRWWNPAVEDQCTDRAHRIGQKRRVQVYLPLARHPELDDHSFDLKLDALLERKRAMNRSVLAPVAPTRNDMRELYEAAVGEAQAGSR